MRLSRADRTHHPLNHVRKPLLAIAVSIGCLVGAPLPAAAQASSAATALAERFAETFGTLQVPGRIEALQATNVAPRLNSVVTEIHFAAGDEVDEGDLLFHLDTADFEIDLARARADLESKSAARVLARQDFDRAENLFDRAAVSEVQVQRARAALDIARADEAQAKVAVRRAEQDVARGRVTAPHDGVIGPPLVAPGAFVEAEAGAALATVVRLDPVRVVYDVPYSAVLQLADVSEAIDVDEVLALFLAEIGLPGGIDYPLAATQRGAAPTIDPETGTLTVWAEVENPAQVLRPGMRVDVTIRLRPDAPD